MQADVQAMPKRRTVLQYWLMHRVGSKFGCGWWGCRKPRENLVVDASKNGSADGLFSRDAEHLRGEGAGQLVVLGTKLR